MSWKGIWTRGSRCAKAWICATALFLWWTESVFWHGWSTASCEPCWTKRTGRCVGLDYEDLAYSAKKVGHDTIQSITFATNMQHFKTTPNLSSLQQLLLTCLGWLGGACWYWWGSCSCLGVGWMSADLAWPPLGWLELLSCALCLLSSGRLVLMGMPEHGSEKAQSLQCLFTLCLCYVCQYTVGQS